MVVTEDAEVAEAVEAWGREHAAWRCGSDAWPCVAKPSPGDDSTEQRPASAPDSVSLRLQRSASEPQRPKSEQGSRRSQRSQSKGTPGPLGPVSQRFSKDELQCFKRIPGPSSNFDEKLSVYWQSAGELRQNLAKDNWNMLPVLKGKFFQHPKLKQSLLGPSALEKAKEEERIKRLEAAKKKADEVEPDPLASEPEVSYVLDRIFPRNPKNKEETKPISKPRRASMLETYSYMGRRSSMTPNGPAVLSPKLDRQRESSSSPSHRSSRQIQPQRFVPGLPGFGMSSRGAMEDFRTKLLEKFTTIKEAFETFMKDLPERQITKLELARALARHGFEWQSKQVRDSIFDRLDFKSVGRVTLVGFYVIVEASAPVRSVEDLRRRWLACRYTMLQAIMIMADNSQVALTHRLTLQEFGSRLQLVNVNEPEEHLAVFKAICHESDHKAGRIMLGDLAAALAVVSPCLLLEDLRDRLQRRYNGDFKKAFSDLDMDRSGTVSHPEFVMKIMDRLHLTEHEARKMFREIDVDGSQEISRNEFVSAIGLSEPSLFLEDLRKKVRQRFRSFKAQFADADNVHGGFHHDCASAPKLLLKNFQELLLPLSMSEKETKVLFNLIDIDHDGRLTIKEFVRGVRHFAPASVLEDLRVRCCQQHERLSDPFVDLDHFKLLDSTSFAEQMVDIGLCDQSRARDPRLAELQPGVPAQALFDILDVANNGEATFSRLLAALQSCGAGTTQRLSPMELDLRAKNDVKHDLAPMHKLVTDVKLQARQGMHYNQNTADENNQMIAGTRIFDALLEHVDTDFEHPPAIDETETVSHSVKGPARLKMLIYEDVLRKYQNQAQSIRAAKATAPQMAQQKRPILNAAHGASDSWTRFWACVQKSPQKREHKKLEEHLQQYFQSAAMKLSHDGPLYHGTEQRLCPDPFLDKSHLEHPNNTPAEVHR